MYIIIVDSYLQVAASDIFRKGSSAPEREETTYMHFLVYLQNCEKSKVLLEFLLYLHV